jgi:hypothetical protein
MLPRQYEEFKYGQSARKGYLRSGVEMGKTDYVNYGVSSIP